MNQRMPLLSRARLLRSALAGSAALLLCSGLLADELRLRDGRVVVGRVKAKELDGLAVLEVQTRQGVVIVRADQVEQHYTDEQLRERLESSRKEAGSTPFAYLRLAIDARSYGLEPEMWRLLDSALTRQEALARKQQESKIVERRLRDFFAQLEPELLPSRYRAANTETRVLKLLDQARFTDKPARARAIEELLVREPNADAALRRQARCNNIEHRRIVALEVLARRGEGQQEPTRFVLRTTILDRDEEVRAAAAAIVRESGQATEAMIDYLSPGLAHADARVRMRTAEAYAALDNPAAIPYLVEAGPLAGTNLAPKAGGAPTGTRGHIAILNQQAYIRDFDVEVASASFIADPKVDVLQSGVVLDVTSGGIFEATVITRIVGVYRRSLQKLAHGFAGPGPDPGEWAAWHGRFAASQAKAAETPERK